MKSATAHHAAEASGSSAAAVPALLGGDPASPHWFDGLPGLAFLGRPDRARTMEVVSDGCRTLLGLKFPAEPFELAPLIHPDDREMVLDCVAIAAAGSQPFAVEYRVRHASGRWHTVWEQSRTVRQGQQVFLQGCLIDVTARAQREAARRAAEQEFLQSQKNFALNKLATGIAHEFNNLIAGILGSAELLSLDLPAGHHAQDSLKNIFEASNRARDFVHKIRALAQRPPLERKLIPLAPVIEDALAILRQIVSDKVELTAHIAPGCPPVHADAASLQQALLEVCLYAWQGLPDRRGSIKISLEHPPRGRPADGSTSSLRPGPHLRLTVCDNSPGLDKHAREKIFDPFHSRKSTGKQMGLEMFTARETIHDHQGEISVESGAGQGTAFHIYLPVAEDI
jgi:nitrogen-specific signal transduction histidine kinase